jgi:hypothetical protein
MEKTSKRRTRPIPARVEPDRSGWSAATAEPPPEARAEALADDVETVVADAVKLGYQVLGDSLHQGRVAASRLSAGTYGLSDVRTDATDIGGRLMKLAGDMARLWIDLVGAVARDPDLTHAVRPREIPPDPTVPGRIPVTVQVRGRDGATGHASPLGRPEAASGLVCPGLHAAAAGLAPITGIGFAAAPDGASILAVVTVPREQPPGLYSGVILDGLSHAVLGTLSVRVPS